MSAVHPNPFATTTWPGATWTPTVVAKTAPKKGSDPLKAWRSDRLGIVTKTDEYKSLTISQRKIVRLLVMAHESESEGITASQTTIGKKLNLTREWVNHQLREIVTAGVFVKEPRHRGSDGGRTSNRYRINPELLSPKLPAPCEVTSQGGPVNRVHSGTSHRTSHQEGTYVVPFEALSPREQLEEETPIRAERYLEVEGIESSHELTAERGQISDSRKSSTQPLHVELPTESFNGVEDPELPLARLAESEKRRAEREEWLKGPRW